MVQIHALWIIYCLNYELQTLCYFTRIAATDCPATYLINLVNPRLATSLATFKAVQTISGLGVNNSYCCHYICSLSYC